MVDERELVSTGSVMKSLESEEDQVIVAIGPIGKWQLLYGGLLMLLILDNSFFSLGIFFMNAPTNYWCSKPANLSGVSTATWRASLLDACHVDESEPCHSFDFDRSQFKRTFVQDFQLVCGKEHLQHYLQVAGFLGTAIGTNMFGFISDLAGRRIGLIVCVVAMQLSTVGLVWAPTAEVVIGMRFLQGLCGLSAFMIAFIWIMECVSTRYKMAATLLTNAAWLISMALLAFIMHVSGDWRAPFFVYLAFSPVLLLVACVCPESPKWLLSVGQVDKAEQIVRKAAKMNARSLDANFKLINSLSDGQKAFVNPLKLFSRPGMAAKSVIMMLNFYTGSLLYYGLTLNSTALSDDLMLQFTLNCFIEAPAAFLGFVIIHKCPRKLPHCLFLTMGGVALIIGALIPTDAKTAINSIALFGKYCASVTYILIYAMVAEIMPTELRAVGTSLCILSSRLPGMLSPFLVAWLTPISPTMPLAVFGASALFVAVLSLMLPETKHVNIPDTLEEAENMKLSLVDGLVFRKRDKTSYDKVLNHETPVVA